MPQGFSLSKPISVGGLLVDSAGLTVREPEERYEKAGIDDFHQPPRQPESAMLAVGFGAPTIESLLAESPAAFFETPELLLEWTRESLLERSCQERK